MNGPARAKDIMVTKLVTLRPEMDVFAAINLLVKHEISGAPVIDQNENFIGIFSEKCSMNVLIKSVYDQLPSTQLFAYVETEVRTIVEETDLLTIAQIFSTTTYRRLPVLREGKLVGQISRRDVLRESNKHFQTSPDRDSALLYLSSLVERSEAPIV